MCKPKRQAMISKAFSALGPGSRWVSPETPWSLFAPAARAVLMPQPRALFPALPRRTRDRLLFSRSSNGESSERTNLLQKRTASLLSAPLTPALLPRGRAHPPRSPVTRRTGTASGAPLDPRASDSAWRSMKLLNE